MKAIVTLGLLVAIAASPHGASADNRAACSDAALKGQVLRNSHKLLEAREQLRACVAVCPTVVQTDCVAWLAGVEKDLPSVVIAARDAAGADLVAVNVSVDGRPFLTRLDGQAVPMDAGPHTFHFETADGARLDQQVVLKEGEKNRSVSVVLGSTTPAPPATSGAPGSPLRTAGWVIGAGGLAGLGVGAVFGIIAIGDKSAAHCNASEVCDPGATGALKSAAFASDVGWIAGGVLLAGGAALVLFAPKAAGNATTSLRIAPTFARDGGGVAIGGSF